MIETIADIVIEPELPEDYIFANEYQENLYREFWNMECEQIVANIIALEKQIELMAQSGSSINYGNGATIDDYTDAQSIAIAAFRDKQEAGLC